MKKMLTNQYGFALIIPIMLAVLVTDAAGTQVYRINESKKLDARLKANSQQPEVSKKANKNDAEKEDAAQVPTPEKSAPAPAPAAPKPKPTPVPAAPTIVSPTAADCGKGPFTVYASASGGAKAYVSYQNTSSALIATYAHGTAMSLECGTDVNNKPIAGWLLYKDGYINYADVSKTKP